MNTKSLAQRRVLKKKILKLSDGLLSSTTDFALFLLFTGVSSVGKPYNSRGVSQSASEGEELLSKINYKSLKNALYNLQKKGLIESARQTLAEPAITKAGLSRLTKTLPTYQQRRPWDKMVYLINYDVPRNKNYYRDSLRNTLQKLRAAPIQNSLFLTPYNPKEILRRFIKENGQHGSILVSTLSKNSSIGEESNIKKMLWNLYNLESVNRSYKRFIAIYKNKSQKTVSKSQVTLDFLSIVDVDPQLPFDLLLPSYKGDEAYLLFRRLTN